MKGNHYENDTKKNNLNNIIFRLVSRLLRHRLRFIKSSLMLLRKLYRTGITYVQKVNKNNELLIDDLRVHSCSIKSVCVCVCVCLSVSLSICPSVSLCVCVSFCNIFGKCCVLRSTAKY